MIDAKNSRYLDRLHFPFKVKINAAPSSIEEAIQEIEKNLNAAPAVPGDGETVTKAECEKRVSGMQSAMAKQIDGLKKEYAAKIENLEIQLRETGKELTDSKESVISLKRKLEETEKELAQAAISLEAEKSAVETLNSTVNAKPEDLPTFKEGLKKCRSPKEVVDFVSSGRYVK